MFTLNCKGRLIDLDRPKVMGIINVTPDSFYDGGKTMISSKVVAQANLMLKQGATFLDVGGYSSRPGATAITEKEETDRVIPAIEAILKEFPDTIISVDTFRANVAKEAVAAGASMVNDISAGKLDPKMMQTVGDLHVPYLMMHMKGNPQNMQQQTQYDDLWKEVIYYFSERIEAAKSNGINDLMIDPGMGFSKTIEQNYTLLKNLELFKMLNFPLVLGVSRKSMIYKTLQLSPAEALNGSTALHAIGLLKGASILRVHDVKEAMECVELIQKMK